MFRPLDIMTFLLLLSNASAAEVFMFPDEASDAIHRLKQEIASAQRSVVIITPKLQSRSLSDSIVKLMGKNVAVTIITAPETPGDSAGLSQYAGITVMAHRGIHSDAYEGTLASSLLLIDSQRLCTSALSFEDISMRHDSAILECSGDPGRIDAYGNYISALRIRAKPYLR